MSTTMAQLGKFVAELHNQQDAKIKAMEARLTSVENTIANHESRITKLENKPGCECGTFDDFMGAFENTEGEGDDSGSTEGDSTENNTGGSTETGGDDSGSGNESEGEDGGSTEGDEEKMMTTSEALDCSLFLLQAEKAGSSSVYFKIRSNRNLTRYQLKEGADNVTANDIPLNSSLFSDEVMFNSTNGIATVMNEQCQTIQIKLDGSIVLSGEYWSQDIGTFYWAFHDRDNNEISYLKMKAEKYAIPTFIAEVPDVIKSKLDEAIANANA